MTDAQEAVIAIVCFAVLAYYYWNKVGGIEV